MSTLENLRKSARRWLKALRADDADAHARLKRADPNAPSNAALRDVQHALAREHGHKSWIDLRRALDDGKTRGAAIPDADQYDTLAKDVLTAYQTRDAAAMHRLQERFRRPITWDALRAEVDHQLRQLPDAVRPSAGLSLADIRTFMARSAGFESWASFLDALRIDGEHSDGDARVAVVPPQSDPGPSGMLQPVELRITLPMELQAGEYATTTDVGCVRIRVNRRLSAYFAPHSAAGFRQSKLATGPEGRKIVSMSHTLYYYAPGGKYVLFLDLLGFTAFVRSSFQKKAEETDDREKEFELAQKQFKIAQAEVDREYRRFHEHLEELLRRPGPRGANARANRPPRRRRRRTRRTGHPGLRRTRSAARLRSVGAGVARLQAAAAGAVLSGRYRVRRLSVQSNRRNRTAFQLLDAD